MLWCAVLTVFRTVNHTYGATSKVLITQKPKNMFHTVQYGKNSRVERGTTRRPARCVVVLGSAP